MWLASTSVMVAVVQCASRVGGSPRLPTLRTPPFFWATASSALPATSAVDTSANSTARTISLDMLHLPVVGEFSRRQQDRSAAPRVASGEAETVGAACRGSTEFRSEQLAGRGSPGPWSWEGRNG